MRHLPDRARRGLTLARTTNLTPRHPRLPWRVLPSIVKILPKPDGDVIHTVLAMTYLALLPLATSPKDIAWAALAVCAVVRLPFTWRCYASLLRDPLLWLVAGWTAWRVLSLLWSPDRMAGLDEMGAFRVLLLPLMVWPVLDRAPWLIGALLVGVFGQNLVQLGQYLHWFGLQPDVNDRLGGFMHPIKAAGLNAAAMCWHLSVLLHVRRRPVLQWIALVGLIAATGGLVVSGSRGPWIAAAFTMPLMVAVTAIRWPATRRAAIIVTVTAVVAAAAAWPVAGDFVTMRIKQATADLASARGPDGDYLTDTGLRLARWSAAWQILQDHPLAGTGAGGFGPAVRAMGRGELAGNNQHAHSVYLHEAATTGALGLLLTLSVLGGCALRAFRSAPGTLYAHATGFVLITWLVGGLFDCYQLNGTMFGLFSVVLALSISTPRSLQAGMRRHWDRLARHDAMYFIATCRRWTRDEFFASGCGLVTRVLDWLGHEAQRGRMLDLGCGLGRTAVAFAAHYERVDAVDISPEMIQRAGALDPPPNIHFALNSGTDLQPFADDRFDLVFSMLVFQHIPGDAVVIAYLAEINRVLRRGGHAVLQFDTRPPTVLSRLYERLPTLLPGGTHGRYIRRYRRRADRLREMIAAAGLEIVDDVHPETAEHLLLLAKA